MECRPSVPDIRPALEIISPTGRREIFGDADERSNPGLEAVDEIAYVGVHFFDHLPIYCQVCKDYVAGMQLHEAVLAICNCRAPRSTT
jgi:hypothetical protein